MREVDTTMRTRIRTILAALLFCCVVLSVGLPAAGKDDYPLKYKKPALDAVVDEWNFFNRECTSFAAFRLNSRNKVAFSNQYKMKNGATWGHAGNWGYAAKKAGIRVDQKPAPGAIAWSTAGPYGHVAWVKSVSGSKVTVEEYNYPIPAQYHTRTVNKSAFTGYIHIKDLIPVKICTKSGNQYKQVKKLTVYVMKSPFGYVPYIGHLYVLVNDKPSAESVKLTSGDPSVAGWFGADLLTAKKPGKTTLTATWTSGKRKEKASLELTVKEIITDLEHQSALQITAGTSYWFFPKIQGPSQKMKWTSSDERIVKLENQKGFVTEKKVGTAVITVKANGVSSSCTVKVLPKPSLKLKKTSLRLEEGKKYTLKAVSKHLHGTEHWTSSNKKVARVDKNGKVTAIAPGTAKIKVEKGLRSASCKVTVTPRAVELSRYFRKSYSAIKKAFPGGKLTKVADTPDEAGMNRYTVGDTLEFRGWLGVRK